MGSSLKAQKVYVLSSQSLGETIWHEVGPPEATKGES